MVKGKFNIISSKHECEEDLEGNCYACGIKMINYKESKLSETFEEHFERNLIYCQDVQSFVHRLFNKRKIIKRYTDAQQEAFKVIREMEEQYEELKKSNGIKLL